MLGDWRGAAVEPRAEQPSPSSWSAVDLPGRPAQFAGADAVAYRTTFADPRESREEHAVLELRGAYAHTRVWLNNQHLASHDAYFRPLRVRLDDALEAENDLLVECRRPTDGFGGLFETTMIPPGDAVPGIWWDATVETHPPTYVDQLRVEPQVADDRAVLTVAADVVAGESLDDHLTFSIRPADGKGGRGMMQRTAVQAAAGERTTVTHEIELHDPALWWPRELGDQNRHVVRGTLGDSERSVTTGLADVELTDDALVVNGMETTGRGVNLLTATTQDVQRAVELNANFVRAHAHVLPADVYEACDEAGLLVWQDLPLTGSVSIDVERAGTLAQSLVETRRRHPSFAAVGVHDDPVSPFDGSPLESGLLDRLRFRVRAWRARYDRGPADAVADRLPDDLVVVPVVGPPGIDADATSLYPEWAYGGPEALGWLRERYPGVADVVAEFGAGSLGVADPDDEWGFDRAKHDAHVADPADVEQSQAYQAYVLKHVAETLRQRDATVLAAFALRDTSDAGMGVVTRDGIPKAGFDVLATAFEPLQAILIDPSPGKSAIAVCNDTDSHRAGTITWTAGDASGDVDFAVDAGGRRVLPTITIPPTCEVVRLQVLTDDRQVSNEYYL